MARIPRKIAGIGASDLPNNTAFDNYVGPERELTVDPIRGIISLHDGYTPGGKRIALTDNQITLPKGRIIAHRFLGEGADSAFIENTIPALNHAMKNIGARFIETDFQITSDGVPVLFHDIDVSWLTTGTGQIKDATFATVQTWNFLRSVGTVFEGRVKIPTVTQFFDECKRLRPDEIIVEYKTAPNGNSSIDAYMGAIVSSGLADKCLIYSGRGIEELEYSVYHSPNRSSLPSFMLFRPTVAGFTMDDLNRLSRLPRPWVLVGYDNLLANPSFVETCRHRGIKVSVYTVNHENIANQLRAIGVDMIMTDRITAGVA